MIFIGDTDLIEEVIKDPGLGGQEIGESFRHSNFILQVFILLFSADNSVEYLGDGHVR